MDVYCSNRQSKKKTHTPENRIARNQISELQNILWIKITLNIISILKIQNQNNARPQIKKSNQLSQRN